MANNGLTGDLEWEDGDLRDDVPLTPAQRRAWKMRQTDLQPSPNPVFFKTTTPPTNS